MPPIKKHPVANQPVEEGQMLFLPSIFNETLALLFDAHEYFQSRGMIEQSTIEHAARADYANEMTRITLRLTSIMAWIMVRRAVHAGRIAEDTAGQQYRLEAAEVCCEHRPQVLAILPFYINHLSERTLRLFERVYRLDTMVYGPRA